MAKSQRSKVKRRWRSLKRQHIENTKVQVDLKEINQKLEAGIHNRNYRVPEPKNAFLYPGDPDAVIPQYKPPTLVDFRSSALPYAGTQFVGARRKKNTVNSTLTFKDEAEEEQMEVYQDEVQPEDATDELVNALDGIKMKSKRQGQKERRQLQMESEVSGVNVKSKTIVKKSRRQQEVKQKKSKKLIKF